MKPALLVIDIQNVYLPMMAAEERDLALKVINGAIWLFRKYNLPIVRIYHTNPEQGPHPDSEAFAFPSTVQIKEDDPKIIKTYPNAFNKTDLVDRLTALGCDTLFLCGLSAVGCVLATYISAMDHDYHAFLIKLGIMSHKAQYTELVEQIYNAVSLETIAFMLEHLGK